MSTEESPTGNRSPYTAVDAKLEALAQAAPVPPPWHNAWSRLKRESTEEERLAVYQSVRRAGSLPEAASFWLVSHMIDEIGTESADDALGSYEDRLEEIEEAHGFDDGNIWPSGAAPANYDQLRRQYHEAWDKLFVQKLDEFGEPEMARLFREDRQRFEQLAEEGRRYFRGSESTQDQTPMEWLLDLSKAVAGCMEADSPMGPLGYRYGEEDGLWMVDIYPTSVELVGGAVDGEIVAPGFMLEVEALHASFERIDSLAWRPLGFPQDEGPRFVVEGAFQGRDVFLQVLAYGPGDEEPGMKLNTIPPEI